MEKSSLNIKSFRNLLSHQGKSYKIPPEDNYRPTEVKMVNGGIIDNAANCSIEDIYSIKRGSKATPSRGCNRRRLHDVICENFIKFIGYYNSNFCLPIFTPVACSICVIIVIAALFGTSWISTEEKIPWLQVNSSFYRSNNFTLSYIIKSSNASLWIICTRMALEDNRTKSDFTHKNCTRIDYFDAEKYQPDPRDSTNESTNVIPYTITLSSPLLIISFIILLISYLLFLLAICSTQKYKIFYFVAGIGFIISGLLMLSGLIMFISIFKSEVYHKLHPSSREVYFNFNYGHSFVLYVIGFVAVELAGILNVCLFNKLQKAEEINQTRLLNNHIKPGQVIQTNDNRQPHIAFQSLDNGYLPQKGLCSLHATSNMKLTNDCFNNMPLRQQHHQQQQQHHHMHPCAHHYNSFNRHIPFTRNASTSTLDLDNEPDEGDSSSMKRHHAKGRKERANSNKLDICGMMRSSKSKDFNSNSNLHRLKPCKNVYYIKDRNGENEPNIFIVDPRFYKNRKCALQKSLEDIRMQKQNNIHARHHHDACMGWNFMDRNYYGSKTLPRDFTRPKCNARPSLGNFLDNFQQNANERLDHKHSHYNLHSHCHPSGYAFHHNSFDELSMLKVNRNFCHQENGARQHEHQWPKVIPKSPSSFSVNSFRINCQSPFDRSSNYNPIEEFDLEKIEHERRKSHTSLFKEGCQKDTRKTTDFGTAV